MQITIHFDVFIVAWRLKLFVRSLKSYSVLSIVILCCRCVDCILSIEKKECLFSSNCEIIIYIYTVIYCKNWPKNSTKVSKMVHTIFSCEKHKVLDPENDPSPSTQSHLIHKLILDISIFGLKHMALHDQNWWLELYGGWIISFRSVSHSKQSLGLRRLGMFVLF